MFSKVFLVALLSFSLFANALALPAQVEERQFGKNKAASTQQCAPGQTKTVTVTANAAAATGKGTNNGAVGNNNNGGKGATTTTTSAAASATTAKGGNNAANGGNGNTGNTGNNNDPQKSLTLLQSVIAKGFEQDGQSDPTAAAGQVASLTSSNNFINFCATVPNLPITNGKQITTGSCNPAPMGIMPSTENMPAVKFVFPQNFGFVKANTAFTIKLAVNKMETGHFTNAQQTYFSAPQTLNGQGQIQGHGHVVAERIPSLDSTTPTNPAQFDFFKGLNSAAVGGILSADVTNGLPVGVYRLSSIMSSANHQPALVPIAQHAPIDDAIYFTVTADGKAPATGGKN